MENYNSEALTKKVALAMKLVKKKAEKKKLKDHQKAARTLKIKAKAPPRCWATKRGPAEVPMHE